ncbi:HAD family hydrolase [Oceanivirga miroungae]|uniref:HAD-superfamily hydrolase n=1 Tax=Oceanivirga miroungae TaxID=1130046 RepID=A0A6I8M6Q4_9FUSO|nr:HAD family hydrolase [Oceanivirga miroungae]VWL85146.1 HAD-superfamily hydrolase [Oceanivirga miroungae]
MSKKIVIFDLDGTLVDTIPAICRSVNVVLKKHGYNTYDVEKFKDFIGKGFSVLFERINDIQKLELSKEILVDEAIVEYNKDFLSGIYIYPNIDKLLSELEKRNIDIAIVTNKDHDLAVLHSKTILKDFNFKYVFGLKRNISYKGKPDPYYLNEIAKEYDKKDMLFVGDMIVDINTAKNANIDMIYLNHGYGEKNLAKISIDDPLEVLKYLG